VATIASTAGGLPEYQPPGCPTVAPDDVDGLTAAFDKLADPEEAARCGRAAQDWYMGNRFDRVPGSDFAEALGAGRRPEERREHDDEPKKTGF
jgi:hypothetical protein